MFRRAVLIALAAVPFIASPGVAQPSTAGAKDIEAKLDAWLQAITDTDLTAGYLQLQIQPQVDGYALTLPLGIRGSAQQATAILRKAASGWRIEQIGFPPLTESRGDVDEHPVQFRAGQQSGTVFIDPTGSTASTGNWSASALSLGQEGENSRSAMTEAADFLVSAVVRPLFDERTDVTIDALINRFSIFEGEQNDPDYVIRLNKSRTSISVQSATTAHTAKLVGAIIAPPGIPAGGMAPLPPSPVPQALADFAAGLSFGETFDTLSFTVGDVSGSLQSGQVIAEIERQSELLSAEIVLDAKDLQLSDKTKADVLGGKADYIPTSLSIHPSIANVSVPALVHLTEISTDPTVAELQALFGQGGIQLAVDSLVLDVGGAEFTGLAKGVAVSPREITLEGTLNAKHFEALSERLGADPSLAEVMPLVIFLKGVGRTNDQGLVWDFTYRNEQLTVNGQNLTSVLQAFLSGTQAAPPPPPPPAPRAPAPPVPRPSLRRQ